MSFEKCQTKILWEWLGVACLLAAGAGCSGPRIHEQRLVSQPAMTFSSSRIWQHESGLTIQLEPGRANSGGGQSAGCTSCR